MSDTYQYLQDKAYELLSMYGDSMLLVSPTYGRTTVKGVFTKNKQKREEDEVSSLVTTERHVVIQGNIQRAPVVGDTLTYNRITYTITDVENVSPTNTTIVFKLKVDY